MSRNIVFIVMDTVRKDHLSVYGYDQPTSPGLNNFADEAAVFTQAITQSPWTLPVHSSLFTGLYPSQHGACQRSPYLKGEPTLAGSLSQAGYSSACFSTNPWVSPYTGLTAGFDVKENLIEGIPDGSLTYPLAKFWNSLTGNDVCKPLLEKLVSIGSHVYDYLLSRQNRFTKAPEVVNQTIEFIEQTTDPYFVFLNLMDAHLPYRPPKKYAEQFASNVDPTSVCQIPNAYNIGARKIDASEWEAILGLYSGAIRTIDAELARLFDWLRNGSDWENTLVIVCSDHGQLHGEHELFGHEFNVYDPVVNVPLLINHPDLKAKVFDEQIELLDLYHTVLDHAGVEARANSVQRIDERSLLSSDYRDFMYSEYAFIQYGQPTMELIELKRQAAKSGRRIDQKSRFFSSMQAIRRVDAKYIKNEHIIDEFYRLDKDPAERKNQYNQTKKVTSQQSLETILSTFTPPLLLQNDTSVELEEVLESMDIATREQLRDLGYI